MRRDLGLEVEKYAEQTQRKGLQRALMGMSTVIGNITESPSTHAYTDFFDAPSIGGSYQTTKRPIVAGTMELSNINTGQIYVLGVDYNLSVNSGVITNIDIPTGTDLRATYFYYSVSGGMVGPQGPKGDTGEQGQAGTNGVWTGAWSSGTSYLINDIVYYLGSSWIALANNSNSAPSEANSNWLYVAKKGTDGANGSPGSTGSTGPPGPAGAGGVWRGDWVNTTNYIINDIVYYLGSSWIALSAHAGQTPAEGSIFWRYVAKKGADGATGGLGPQGPPGPAGTNGVWRGVWDSVTSYVIHDIIYFQGSSWIALANNTNSPPSEANTNWQYVAKKGTDGSVGAAGFSVRAQESGTIMALRTYFNFRTGFNLTDDPTNDRINIDNTGGSGGSGGSARYASLVRLGAV